MINLKMTLPAVVIFLLLGAGFVNAQKKAPDYAVTDIKITPFDSQTGKFEDELTEGKDRTFFNDLSISLFVAVEISGEAGSFEAGRKIQIIVMEGKKMKTSRNEQIGLIGENGKFYVPVWLYPAMCSEIKITARILGQTSKGSLTKTIPFQCGE